MVVTDSNLNNLTVVVKPNLSSSGMCWRALEEAAGQFLKMTLDHL
jgi:hypothetical protein